MKAIVQEQQPFFVERNDNNCGGSFLGLSLCLSPRHDLAIKRVSESTVTPWDFDGRSKVFLLCISVKNGLEGCRFF